MTGCQDISSGVWILLQLLALYIFSHLLPYQRRSHGSIFPFSFDSFKMKIEEVKGRSPDEVRINRINSRVCTFLVKESTDVWVCTKCSLSTKPQKTKKC